MYLSWFHEELKEEIAGAKTYIKKALEVKAMSEKMAKTFYEMAIQESEHAKNIYTMSMEYFDKIASAYSVDTIPEYLCEIRDNIIDCYTKEAIDLKMLIAMYKD